MSQFHLIVSVKIVMKFVIQRKKLRPTDSTVIVSFVVHYSHHRMGLRVVLLKIFYTYVSQFLNDPYIGISCARMLRMST